MACFLPACLPADEKCASCILSCLKHGVGGTPSRREQELLV